MKIHFPQPILIALFALPFCFQPAVHAQSLWHEESSRPIFADKRAAAAGDILTIIVAENSSANKNNETKTEKNSSWTAAITSALFPGFLAYRGASALAGAKGSMPSIAYNSDLKHDGSGAINNSQTMVAQVAVTVKEVLPNRNLVIEGKRETSFAGERQTIVVHGIVRPEDVSSANTVLSYNVADATIQIDGKGSVTDAQRKGWFTRILDKVIPF
jgi:flagellar L-ring protein precursor FlgH